MSLCLFSALLSLGASGAALNHSWSTAFGDASLDIASDVATNALGDVVVVGSFEGDIDFGGTTHSSVGSQDIYIAKFDRFGAYQWSLATGDSFWDAARGVAIDGFGNVFVTGFFQGSVEFGGAALFSVNERDIFLAKFDTNGNHVWSKALGGAHDEAGLGIDVLSSGTIAITGSYDGSVSVGGGTLPYTGILRNAFVAKYDSFGTHMWSVGFDASDDMLPGGVAMSSGGHVAVAGDFTGTADFGAGPVASTGQSDMFVVKLDPSGFYQWSHTPGGFSMDAFDDVAFAPNGHLVAAGRFAGTVDFGGGPRTTLQIYTPALVEYDVNGAYQWDDTASGAAFPETMAIDDAGDIYVSGRIWETVNFGGMDLTSAGDFDVYLARYTSSGEHRWSQSYGGALNDAPRGIAIDGSGHPVLVGRFDSTIHFGGVSLPAQGPPDAFVAKFFPCLVIEAAEDDGNDRGFGLIVSFERHFLDGPPIPFNPPGPPVTSYSIWRAVDVPPMYPPDPIHSCAGPGKRVCDGWERVAVVAATAKEQYAVPTVTTRNVAWNDPALHYFAVVAEDDQGGAYPSDAIEVTTTNELGAGILAIDDVPNDEGRAVRIRFDADSEDAPGATTPVLNYEIYRRDDPPPAKLADWTLVATMPAFGVPEYAVEAPTIGDSTLSGDYDSTFFVRAATETPTVFFDSAAASGSSIDNLAPAAPKSLAYAGGALEWGPPEAADFDYFSVYGATEASFAEAMLLDHAVQPELDVAGKPFAHYFVTATDEAGNESEAAMVRGDGTGGGLPSRWLLSLTNHPNPFNPSTTLRYTLPAAGRLTLTIHDARGKRIATLVDGRHREAGAHRLVWDGRASDGRIVASGVYYARIEHPSGKEARKLLLVK